MRSLGLAHCNVLPNIWYLLITLQGSAYRSAVAVQTARSGRPASILLSSRMLDNDNTDEHTCIYERFCFVCKTTSNQEQLDTRICELEGEVILLPLMDRMTQKVKGGPILHLLGRTNPFGVAPKQLDRRYKESTKSVIRDYNIFLSLMNRFNA